MVEPTVPIRWVRLGLSCQEVLVYILIEWQLGTMNQGGATLTHKLLLNNGVCSQMFGTTMVLTSISAFWDLCYFLWILHLVLGRVEKHGFGMSEAASQAECEYDILKEGFLLHSEQKSTFIYDYFTTWPVNRWNLILQSFILITEYFIFHPNRVYILPYKCKTPLSKLGYDRNLVSYDLFHLMTKYLTSDVLSCAENTIIYLPITQWKKMKGFFWVSLSV